MGNLIKMSGEERERIRKERFESLEKKFSENADIELKDMYLDVPNQHKMLFLKVHAGEPAIKERLKLKCLDCVCWTRSEVTLCEAKTCSLWKIRPFQDAKVTASDD